MKFHVLHVDTGSEWRGGQQQVLYLLKGMQALGIDCSLMCPEQSPLWKRALEIDIELISIPSGWSLTGCWKIQQAKSDLVACHTSHAHGMSLFQKKPVVVHRRVDFPPRSRLKYRQATAYIAVSSLVARLVQEAGGKQIHVVYDGVDPNPGQLISDAPDILAVGALVPHKGHRYLAEAALMMPELRFAVAGEGDLRYPSLEHLGYREDVPDLLYSSKIFVHPSIEEGMGQVLVEAMLAGIPIVASRVGGIPEVVGSHGLLVPSRSPMDLARAIQQVLDGDHPDIEAARLSAKQRFSVSRMVEETVQVYGDVLR